MSTLDQIAISDRRIGAGHPPYVIAELSANHNGTIERAFAIIEAAKAAGADAVKLQTYKADSITIDHDGPGFRIESGPWAGRSLHDLYREASMPWDWHAPLFAKARELGIVIFSSPFDEAAVELLEGLDAPAYKIASFEVVDLPLILRVAATGKPMIISTGMATVEEIGEAVAAARGGGCRELALLHCVSAYPAPPEDSNLRTIADMAERFDAVIGLSDHTLGSTVAVAAIAQGARIIEKHVTLRRDDGGPDAGFSLEPPELRTLVDSCRCAWEALGEVNYGVKASEADSKVFRRSLYAVDDIEEGEVFTNANIRSIRPGYGLPPKYLPSLLGQTARKRIARGTPINWSMATNPGNEDVGPDALADTSSAEK